MRFEKWPLVLSKLKILVGAEAIIEWVAMRMEVGSWTTRADDFHDFFQARREKQLTRRCEIRWAFVKEGIIVNMIKCCWKIH